MSGLYLVRHAQASFGAENYDKLSELGLQQSDWLGEYLAETKVDFDVVYRGDMVRHRETLEGIAKSVEVSSDILINPALNEFDFKSIASKFIELNPDAAPGENADRAEFYRVFKKALYAWANDELGTDIPESWSDFSARAEGFLQQIRSEHAGKKVLVVSSGGIISMLVSKIMKAHKESVIELNLQMRNASITHCYFNERDVRLHTFNEVPYLQTPERREQITYS